MSKRKTSPTQPAQSPESHKRSKTDNPTSQDSPRSLSFHDDVSSAHPGEGVRGLDRKISVEAAPKLVLDQIRFDNIESGSITPKTIRGVFKDAPGEDGQRFIIKEYEHGENIIKRFALNPDIKGLVGTPLTKKELHQTEIEIFSNALKELEEVPSAEALKLEASNEQQPSPPNNIVLVDIFKREDRKDNKIGEDPKKKCAEVHTVCLWKKLDATIVLIDPSSTSFSEYLQQLLQDLYKDKNIKIEVHNHEKNKFYVSDEMKIPVGNFPQSRDCIDIAVKINESQKVGLSIEQTQQSINDLSNQSAPNKKLKNKFDNIFIRELQASDPAAREDVLGLLERNKDKWEKNVWDLIKKGKNESTSFIKLQKLDGIQRKIEKFNKEE